MQTEMNNWFFFLSSASPGGQSGTSSFCVDSPHCFTDHFSPCISVSGFVVDWVDTQVRPLSGILHAVCTGWPFLFRASSEPCIISFIIVHFYFLIACPKKASFFFFTMPTNSLFTFSFSRMLTLVLLSSPLTLSSLWYSHISADSICLMSCCLMVHPSYVITVHTRHLRSLSFRLLGMFFIFPDVFELDHYLLYHDLHWCI